VKSIKDIKREGEKMNSDEIESRKGFFGGWKDV
jgi:hypothetical protein